MCSECGRIICDSSCPNAEEPKVMLTCSECGKELHVGDKYFGNYEIGIFCKGCMKTKTAEEVLDMLDEEFSTVEEEW